MPTAPTRHATPGRATFGRRAALAGGLLGFALGGFFDGILLHQVLQWHHLLSGLEGAAFEDLRLQILMDGLFHALMYLVALSGLWLLWCARAEAAAPGADRLLLAHALIGFGLWHLLDGLVSHWLLGLHRIRMDSPNPLFWDLLWFLAFGLAVLVAGFWLRRRPGGGTRAGATVALTLAITVTLAGPMAARPPADSTTVIALFPADTPPTQVFGAAAAADARLVWSDPSGRLWALDLDGTAGRQGLYRHGALLVSGGVLAAVCLNWTLP